tara:strand:- start:331 stop:501 length:171 start_codon:yes stop_codon:yes gene_type:complete
MNNNSTNNTTPLAPIIIRQDRKVIVVRRSAFIQPIIIKPPFGVLFATSAIGGKGAK